VFLDRKIKSLKLKKKADLSQRLKRSVSIIQKLKLQKNMSLSRMQDVGGLRVVLPSLEDVYNLRNLIKESENRPSFKSQFLSEYDYISHPKESGYRSLHLIYKYLNDDKDISCRIEIQIRTKLHHAWATAIEVLGTYLKQPLKQSLGDSNLLSLFQKISKAFILLENNKKDDELFKQIRTEVEKTNLIDKLQSFSVIPEIIKEAKKAKYFLIRLSCGEKRLRIVAYEEKEFEKANREYTIMEQKYFDNREEEIVLVSVDSIKKLQKLYPNYFLDTKEFLVYLNKILKV